MEMRIQRIAKAVLLVLLASLFLTGGISVLAVEGINAEIPVSASGVDCEAALYDESGELLQTLPLKTGDTDAFQVYCDGLGSHQFKICLLDQDTETAVFDKTVYSVDIEVFYNDKTAGRINENEEQTCFRCSGGVILKRGVNGIRKSDISADINPISKGMPSAKLQKISVSMTEKHVSCENFHRKQAKRNFR